MNQKMQELQNLLREQETPLLSTLHLLFNQREEQRRKQGKPRDEEFFIDSKLFQLLRKELAEIRELQIDSKGFIHWDGYKIVPVLFTELSIALAPNVQFCFFVNHDTRTLEGL